jgi:hypothetical protein
LANLANAPDRRDDPKVPGALEGNGKTARENADAVLEFALKGPVENLSDSSGSSNGVEIDRDERIFYPERE